MSRVIGKRRGYMLLMMLTFRAKRNTLYAFLVFIVKKYIRTEITIFKVFIWGCILLCNVYTVGNHVLQLYWRVAVNKISDDIPPIMKNLNTIIP